MWLLRNRLVTSDGHTANCRSVDCFVLHLKKLKAETLQKVLRSCASADISQLLVLRSNSITECLSLLSLRASDIRNVATTLPSLYYLD